MRDHYVSIMLFSVLFLTVNASRKEITSLPGWDGPLPSKMYSGYTHCGTPPGYPNGDMFMHYWIVESERDPLNDPLVMWYNGGPGASSIFGLTVELGPLLLNELSLENPMFNRTGVPQLVRNPYSWSKVANVLIVDNPPPVGFSYCTPAGVTGDGYSCGTWNDELVAKANHEFLKNWIKEFPEYVKRDFYLTGESYAGVYVPMLVRELLNEPVLGINIKGFAVGDGCIGTEVLCGARSGPWYYMQFMHGHGQVSNDLYYQILDTCGKESLLTGHLTEECKNLVQELKDSVGGYYDYNLYDECVDQIFSEEAQYWGTPHIPTDHSELQGALNDYPCPGDALGLWLKRDDVRQALGVPVNSNFFSGDNGVGFNYTLTEKNLLPFYHHVITKTNLRVLVYNGDTDPGINSFITQDIYVQYLGEVGVPQIQKWRPWTLDGKQRMGGYVIEYAGSFSYLTIRGSGHMVPEYKPEAAFSFISNWLDGKEFPKYRK